MTQNFFQQIPAIREFDQLTDASNFYPAPENWSVAVADIAGSTNAVHDGRYRDVNLIGAAVITSILDLAGDDLPFAFGGDGAAVLIPTEQTARCRQRLSGLVWLAKARFNLDLRAAIYPVHEVICDSVSLDVARLQLIGNCGLAEFKGGGISRAEEFLKERPETLIQANEAEAKNCSLNKLSCRWQNIQSRNGTVLAILVLPKNRNNLDILGQVINQIRDISGGSISQLNPISQDMKGYKTIWHCLVDERRLHPTIWCQAYFKRVLSILISVPLFGWGGHLKFKWAKNYVENLHLHADYRKMDDALKLVLDCSKKQAAEIKQYLELQHQAGILFYGTHIADTSQMTCYVESTSDAKHIHFVDGGDGGYAVASMQLKTQIESARSAGHVNRKS